MFWFLILLLNLSFFDPSEARHHRKLSSSAVIVGTVFCDTCFQEKFSETSHFISGATVVVKCGNEGSKQSFREEVKTDKRGEFKVKLPVYVSKHLKKIEECYVELIKSSEPYCAVAAKTSSLQLKSKKQGIFSAGFFTFKPLKQPNLCNQKPQISNTFDHHDMKEVQLPTVPPAPTFEFPSIPSPRIENPTVPISDKLLPPLPFLPGLLPLPKLPPLPQLPPLPPLPGLPIFPPKKSDENNAPNETPNISEKQDQFHPQRPHLLHHHHPLLARPRAGAGGHLTSSSPSLPDLPEISSPLKQTSP